MTKPFISCLCPTWRRPELLANAIKCFEKQDYQGVSELIVFDDSGQLENRLLPVYESCGTAEWEIVHVHRRFNSLPEKYNALAGMARGDVLAVWEDDDIYLSHHLSTIAENIEERMWAKPNCVRSLYTGHSEIEDADGRFHASIALTREAFIKSGGWPVTTELNFDQQMFQRLVDLGGLRGIYNTNDPSYVFRWGSTRSYHGQGLGDGWWDKAANQGDQRHGPIIVIPKFDEETEGIFR